MTNATQPAVAPATESGVTRDEDLALDLGISLRELRRMARIHEDELKGWGGLSKARARIGKTTQFETKYAFNPFQAELLCLLSDCESGEDLRERLIQDQALRGMLNWDDRTSHLAASPAGLRALAAELLALANECDAVQAQRRAAALKGLDRLTAAQVEATFASVLGSTDAAVPSGAG